MEILHQLTFLERGIFAGLIIGFICPLVGAFLLVRRVTIISEALSHITLTGITAGVFISQTATWLAFVNPLYSGLFFSLLGSILIEKLRQIYKGFQELAVPIILSTGIGLSAILISLASSSYMEWYTYLFGSIVTVSLSDLYFIIGTGIVACFILFAFYKELLSISFDQEFAKTSGIKVKRLNFLFSLLIAIVISMSMKVVGILLVGAMVTLPVAASIQLAKSFRQVIILGILFGEAAIIGGIFFSYQFNIATGGMIVVIGIFLLFIATIIKQMKKTKIFTVYER
ncbi:metal ABC transporter permease [Evansella cellulosilytica]|uniref:ABC-3 protein n=1 Tax=Evansella cellulosilytica (strain ATCC 21833 / DSM 2522 / FERM P-1141 / JCM 9156 / N-4) TaxID=649639 RepID=E6TWU7_EVAC2|nr:metal ABC transporter permease [Evansella cellulosilytica]ADU29897.1 ABC-3 protein [Evansella cellulosilytica DSM 2522]